MTDDIAQNQVKSLSTRQKVIAQIKIGLSERFEVIDNTGTDKKIIAGQFPDVLIFKKVANITEQKEPPLFIMKVENGGELIDSLPQWQSLGIVPSAFYIVVPKIKLDDAKKLAAATGVRARFAWYEEVNNVMQVHYE